MVSLPHERCHAVTCSSEVGWGGGGGGLRGKRGEVDTSEHIILLGSVLNRVGTGLKQGLSPRSLISLSFAISYPFNRSRRSQTIKIDNGNLST